MNGENVKGPTAAFCTFTPFKSVWSRLWNKLVLRASPVATDAIRARRFLHHMSFTSIGPRALKRAGLPHDGRPRWGAMLFISAYNGSTELYFRGFNKNLAKQMNDLWRGSVDWKGADVYDTLAGFIDDYHRPSNFYFNAYQDSSVNLRAALRLRADLDDLVALAHAAPERFLEGYRQAAQNVWGTPVDTGRAT